jgi:hypothetical protein
MENHQTLHVPVCEKSSWNVKILQQGLDTTTAQRFTAYYLEGSDPFKLLRTLR